MIDYGGAELVIDLHADLGEGPFWHDDSLYFVNINVGEIHRYRPQDRSMSCVTLGRTVGSAVPRASGGLVAASADAFLAVADDGSFEPIATVAIAHEAVRFNDGKCDPAGRFWAGTMDTSDPMSGLGDLYVLDVDRTVRHVLDDVRISNGLGWSPDHKTMYYVDTLRGIDAFDYDVDTGHVANRRRLVTIDPRDGAPDGMCTDSEGHLWVAMWGGYCVKRFAPDGSLEASIAVAAKHTSSCAFGGVDLRDLYITSATQDLEEADLAKDPFSGALFRMRLGVPGELPSAYAG
jgi:sugar lactone lactonase YvrE